MADDYIDMDTASIQKQIAELEYILADMEREVCTNIMDNVMLGAAKILHEEQKRILLNGPTEGIRKMASEVSMWKSDKAQRINNITNYHRYVSYRIGYKESADNLKHFVIEFGRPGKKGKTTDSLGRRIGKIEPYPHIRAAWFLKKDAINHYIAQHVNDEILERWNRN